MTNVKPLTKLFGDSSYIVHFLTWLGYRLTPVVQTGSNFGTGVKHESPYLSAVGSGTMVADGLSIINADLDAALQPALLTYYVIATVAMFFLAWAWALWRCPAADRGDERHLASLLADRLAHDEHHLARVAMRHHYFDDLDVGESTGRFLTEVSRLVTLRDELLAGGAQAAITA